MRALYASLWCTQPQHGYSSKVSVQQTVLWDGFLLAIFNELQLAAQSVFPGVLCNC
jgi:hypothetical protein